jgi:hypothetical protein
MRSVPAFVMSCRPRRDVRFALALLWALSMGIGAWWAARHLLLPDGQAIAVALPVMALSAAVAWRFSASPALALRWNGSQWLVRDGDAERAGKVVVRFDMAGWMLLRFRADNGTAEYWLTIARAASPQAWHPLRCALYSPRLSAATGAADGPVSTSTRDDSP